MTMMRLLEIAKIHTPWDLPHSAKVWRISFILFGIIVVGGVIGGIVAWVRYKRRRGKADDES